MEFLLLRNIRMCRIWSKVSKQNIEFVFRSIIFDIEFNAVVCPYCFNIKKF